MAAEGYRSRSLGRALNRLASPLYLDAGGDHRDAVFLAGSGRSGTTWASEIVNHRRAYRYVFEPLHPEKVKPFARFRWKQYLRPDDRREEYLEPVRAALSGRLRSAWTDRFHRRFVARKRLVKDVRANLLLGWLRANFPGMPLVLMMRHPCAVAHSKMRLGWPSRVEEVLEQPQLVEDFVGPFVDEIRTARTEFERHVFVWCVENHVPLRQLAPADVHLLFYENLCEDPDAEARRLLDFLGESPPQRGLRAGKPSPVSRDGSAVLSGERPTDSWRRFVPREQVGRASEILALFGLDAVYGEGPMPDLRGARALMRGVAGGVGPGGGDAPAGPR